MHLETWISIAAVGVAVVSLVFSRRDAQSQKTVREMDELRKRIEASEREIERNQGEIRGLRERIRSLEAEKVDLENENVRLMRAIINCPTDDCPVLPRRPGGLPERRRGPRDG